MRVNQENYEWSRVDPGPYKCNFTGPGDPPPFHDNFNSYSLPLFLPFIPPPPMVVKEEPEIEEIEIRIKFRKPQDD